MLATVPTSMFGFWGGAATMVAGIETFNRARILELRQFSWKRITSLDIGEGRPQRKVVQPLHFSNFVPTQILSLTLIFTLSPDVRCA